MAKNIIVTGPNGFLGSYLVRQLSEMGVTVWAIVRSENSDIRSIQGLKNVQIIICPLSSIETLPTLLPKGIVIDTCYHLAWCSGGKLKEAKLDQLAELIPQSIQLMNAVYGMGCRRFVGIGSIMENNTALPLPIHHNVAYGVTKDCTNKLLTFRARELGIRFCWCRLCSLYGGTDKTGNLISYAISTLQQGKSPEFSSAIQPYTFLHVEDCAAALICIGENTTSTKELLTIPGPDCRSVREYMEQLQKLVAPEIPLRFGVRPDDGIRYKREWFDNTILKDEFGFSYKYTFQEGILKTIEK